MKIVCISDTHGQLPDIGERGDILIHAGDYSRLSLYFKDNLEVLMHEATLFADWLKRMTHKFRHVLFTPGNHDLLFESYPGIGQQLLRDRGISYLGEDGLRIEGVNFLGCSMVPAGLPPYNGWAFEARDPIRKFYWGSLKKKVDVLVTHSPALGTLDLVSITNENKGCPYIAAAVRRLEPGVHISGHIHDGYGESRTDKTHSINACYLNECLDLKEPNPLITTEIF